MNYKDTIEYVHKKIDEPGYQDWSLCAYMLRDFPEVKEKGCDDLAWMLSKEYCHKNDLIGLLELLKNE